MTARHYSPRNVAIVITEQLVIVLSLALAIGLDLDDARSGLVISQVCVAALLYLTGFYYADLYNFAELHHRRELVTAGLRAFSSLALMFGSLFLFTSWLHFHSATILVHLPAAVAFVLLIRPHVDALLTRYGVVTRIAIVGTGQEAHNLAEQISRRRESGHIVSCFASAGPSTPLMQVRSAEGDARTIPVIATTQLLDFAASYRLKRILVATGDLGDDLPLEDLLRCKAEGFEVLDGHTFLERLVGRIFLADLSPRWLIFSDGFKRSATARVIKRMLDILAAGSIAVLTAPVCLLVAIVIKLQDGGPVLYHQTRVGQRGEPFTLFKFRSMRVDAEAMTGPKWADHDDPRVTRFGRWIRDLRIDEIPQAWNVLRGDMSFVGPRPERPEFVARLVAAIPFYEYRHVMRPGITGWAQVNLPYTATVEDSRDKIEYDLYYLKNFSPLMDIFIMARTVKIILFGWGSR